VLSSDERDIEMETSMLSSCLGILLEFAVKAVLLSHHSVSMVLQGKAQNRPVAIKWMAREIKSSSFKNVIKV